MQAARELFVRDGYESTSVAAIAERAGVSVDTVYASVGRKPEVVRAAFAKVSSPGRLEVVRRNPAVILDAAHNPGGAEAAARAISEEFTFEHLVGVFAAMKDKDVRGVLEAFEPVMDEIVVTRNSTLRSMPVEELAALAEEVFGEGRVIPVERLDDAIDRALALAEAGVPDPSLGGAGVLVTGSVVTAGDAGRLLRG